MVDRHLASSATESIDTGLMGADRIAALDMSLPLGRDRRVDVLKGLAIVFVVWSHTIQQLCSDEYMFSDLLVRAICLVHMPLFIFLSGYVSDKALKMDWRSFVGHKFRGLIVPALPWFAILLLIRICAGALDTINWHGVLGEYIWLLENSYWFLVVLFEIFIIFKVVISVSDKTWVCLSSILLVMLLPNCFPQSNWLKPMYGFFVLGYLAARHDIFSRKAFMDVRLILLMLIIYSALILVSDRSNFIYYNNFDVWSTTLMPTALIMRYIVICLAGCSGIFILFYAIDKLLSFFSFSHLDTLGRNTLYIYLVQAVIFTMCDYKIIDAGCLDDNWIRLHLVSIVVGLALCESCLLYVLAVKRLNLTPYFFLQRDKRSK